MFTFKQFHIEQDRTAMKVGTDGVLLGTWAEGGRTILDIGTGTGLVALMMAQRFEDAQVVGIDIDPDASEQARENVAASPFASRISILHTSLQAFSNGANPERDPSSVMPTLANPYFFAKKGTLWAGRALLR